MDNCIFCKIVKGEIPSYKVYEDDNYLAFLDIRPIKEGHTLIVPKFHVENIFEMEDGDYQEMMMVTKRIAQNLEVLKPKSGKIGMIIYGLDIPHAHIHLVPIDEPDDLNFAKAVPASPDFLKSTLEKLFPKP